MIKRYNIENKDETYLRIWQKVNFGKEFLEPGFIADRQIADTAKSHKLSIYQFDPNTRIFYLDDYLYWVTSDEAIYNYLDTGRAVGLNNNRSYYNHDKNVIYIYNDMLIADKVIIGFEKYKDKESLSLKLLAETEFHKVYLIFNEDLDKIKQRLAELEAEEKEISQAGKQEEIKNEQEAERLVSLIRQYDKMTLLEDNNAIIKDNYFIDKDEGLKIEFKDKVVKLFDKDDLITESQHYNHNGFIVMDYRHFLQKLERVYSLGKYAEPIEEKLKTLNKKWLNFKIYSYDKETKAEQFIKEIKIENNVNDKGKLRFKVNGVKMPIQKMSKVMEFIAGGHYNHSDTATKIDRIRNLEKYLEQIRLFSGTQLELLQGKTIEIRLNGVSIPIHFNIMAEDKEHWEISIDDFKIKRYYTSVKDSFGWLRGGGLTAISGICDTLKAGQKLEDILINRIKGYVEKKRLAEERAEGLFKEFLEKNKTRVFAREGGYIVKGKLKNYIVKIKNAEDCGVWTYPANDYICIEEKTKAGKYLCKYDKLLQFCLTMMNDNNMREQIYTIR
jgi:hypothetical protein